jgi:hypothetical protein
MAVRNGISIAFKNLLKPSIGRQNPTKTLFSTDNKIKEKIDGLVANNKVVVFMKGDPSAPKCGFSNAVVQVINN